MRRVHASLWIAPVLVLSACGGGSSGGGPGAPAGDALVIKGVVSLSGSQSAGSPLAGAEVRASVDRNKDGTITADETVTVTSGDAGAYQLSIPVKLGEIVVVRFSTSDSAPILRTVEAGPTRATRLNATLRQLEAMTCTEQGGCDLKNGRLTLEGLPTDGEGAPSRVQARVFNPVAEADAFPGGFNDKEGNLLISGVFSAVKLENASGETIERLDAPADMRMAVPRDTWGVIKDMVEGDGRIQVPLYSFNEATGQWVADGEAILEDELGAEIPAGSLADIRAGAWTGQIFAHGAVQHFSYWNVDWPVESHTCITGRVLREGGEPAEGAMVLINGVTYTGSSTPVTLGPDGRFCREVMRSESDGEDVDQDGKLGQTNQVSVRVIDGEAIYDLGTFATPALQATCEGGGCMDMGDLTEDESKKKVPSKCVLSGVVRDAQGNPVADATIWASDESIPSEELSTWQQQCMEQDPANAMLCLGIAQSAADGTFSVMFFGVDAALGAYATDKPDLITERFRYGQRTVQGCPAQPLTVTFDTGWTSKELTVHTSGDAITWEPALPATGLWVYTAAGDPKWLVTMPEGSTSVTAATYGVLPADGTQVWPSAGSPAALVAGDRIDVWSVSTDADGYPVWGLGTCTYPCP